jgi:hypothetical protein
MADNQGQTKPPAREQVLRRLFRYLGKLNKPSPKKCCEWLDRPVFVTILSSMVGATLIAFLTWYGQTRIQQIQYSAQKQLQDLQYTRSRLDQKFQLLRVFPTVKEANGNYTYHRISLVFWEAGEINKSAGQKREGLIKDWRAERQRLQTEQWKMEPLDGVLAQIAVIFSSKETRTKADDMKKKWSEFESLMYTINDAYNKKESLTAEEIRDYEAKSNGIVSELNALSRDLIDEMGKEITSGT